MPTFSALYERCVKGIINSNMEYEKMEFDISYTRRLQSLKTLNLRSGYGFYSNRNTMYFIDYTNLHGNYLPDGWEDEWTGEFQLLKSEWYNSSRFYFRANASYESPLLFLTFTPFIGKLLEAERLCSVTRDLTLNLGTDSSHNTFPSDSSAVSSIPVSKT